MRILVCGGRDYSDDKRVGEVLNRYRGRSGLTIIQGEASGADSLAREWAKSNNVQTIGFRANWGVYGKRAGYIRNVEMLNEGKPDLVIAFPGGKGTEMMMNLAKAAGVPVEQIKEKEND